MNIIATALLSLSLSGTPFYEHITIIQPSHTEEIYGYFIGDGIEPLQEMHPLQLVDQLNANGFEEQPTATQFFHFQYADFTWENYESDCVVTLFELGHREFTCTYFHRTDGNN